LLKVLKGVFRSNCWLVWLLHSLLRELQDGEHITAVKRSSDKPGWRAACCKTVKSTVKEVLKQSGINITEDDYVSVPLDTKLKSKKGNVIDIKKAVPVTVIADGQEFKLMTSKKTVREALEGEPVNLGHLDRVEGAGLDDEIVGGMKLKVVRVKKKLVSENEIIPYNVIKRENGSNGQGRLQSNQRRKRRSKRKGLCGFV